ncbi:MAG: phosphoenolpyruvate--protein phosphotransferase [Kiritimatiellia bacterium]
MMSDNMIQSELRLEGVPLSQGCAVARVCMFNEKRHSNLPIYKVGGSGVDKEIARFRRAVSIVHKRLDTIRKEVRERLGKAESEIFVAQEMLLDDETMHREILSLIRENELNAETAVTRVLDDYERRLAEVNDEYIKERASDFGEVKRRLLDVFANMNPSLQCAGQEHCQKGRYRVIVAEELTPSLTVELETQDVMGFVTEHGGVNSHAAILSRALGVPAVSGVKGIRDKVTCGTEILVDGTSGEVVIWPTEETVQAVKTRAAESMKLPEALEPVAALKVMSNISLSSDAKEALHMKAEGIGLYRTEFEIIAAGRLLNEDEMYERYAKVVQAMDGRQVVFRLPDVGSDKSLPFLEIPPEMNPSLGYRGARLLLSCPDLLRTHARALARASIKGGVDVLYPMIVDVKQFLDLKKKVLESIRDVSHGEIRHGVMFEVPSACLQAETIFAEADFGSIGTNDLTQYVLAVDRDNELVAADYDTGHPALWQLMETVAAAARMTGKDIAVCGEIGGDPRYIRRLLDMGIRTVSVSSRRISAVRAIAGSAEKDRP